MSDVDIDTLYRAYGEAVFRRARRTLSGDAAAWDVTQETFLRAHKYASSFRGEGSVFSWLLTIADRCVLDALRKQRADVNVDDVEHLLAWDAGGAEPAGFSRDMIVRLLADVPERERHIVMHRYFDELSFDEVAARTGVSEKTVRRCIERFLQSARARLAATDNVR